MHTVYSDMFRVAYNLFLVYAAQNVFILKNIRTHFRPMADVQNCTQPQEVAMTAINKILVAVDFSDHSKHIADYANLLATKLGASLVVVYAAPSLSQYVGFHVPPNSIENFVGEIVSGAEKSMEAFLTTNFSDIPTTGKVVTGYAAEEILATAEREGVDMIIMGTHGRKGIDRILFGSVAEKVVKGANIPVLTVRPTEL